MYTYSPIRKLSLKKNPFDIIIEVFCFFSFPGEENETLNSFSLTSPNLPRHAAVVTSDSVTHTCTQNTEDQIYDNYTQPAPQLLLLLLLLFF